MNRMTASILALALIAAALAAGYWLGNYKAEGERRKAEVPSASAAATNPTNERKILYYRNPMGLPDTSPTPKKDQMGMDYIPVYEGEEPDSAASGVKVSIEKVQRLGVKTEAAAMRELVRTVRAVGTVQVDERQLHTVAPKFEGWIERLHVNTTGQPVARGQALMEVYSPDLVSAQQEYVIAWKGVESVKDGTPEARAGMQRLMASALERLRNWDISEEELRQLQKEGRARQTVTLRSPVSGVVLEKPALKGMRFMPGEALYRIANLSSLWLLADIFEQDLAAVQPGQAARIRVNAYPDQVFTGRVAFVYPTVTSETRTAKARIELANTGGLLKPAMYANVELAARGARAKALTVPDSAVLDSGTRQIVLVERGEGRFEPRPVRLGTRADGYVEVLEGVQAGEKVVVSANFLIDAESNLRAALGTFGAPAARPAAQPDTIAIGQSHRARGTVRAVDLQGGKINIEHEPIASLNWPAMTMDFVPKDKALLKGLKPGQDVEFEIVQQAPAEFVLSRITPRAGGSAQRAPAPAAGHAGH